MGRLDAYIRIYYHQPEGKDVVDNAARGFCSWFPQLSESSKPVKPPPISRLIRGESSPAGIDLLKDTVAESRHET